MNFIIKRQFSVMTSHFRSLAYRPLNASKRVHLFGKCVYNPRSFQSVNNLRANRTYFTATFNVLLYSQIGPFVGMALGIVLHNVLKRNILLKRRSIVALILQNPFSRVLSFSVLPAIWYFCYENYKTETPITKRKQFMLFEKESYEEISHILFKVLYNSYKDKVLGVNHKATKKVDKIVKRLLESNKEFEEIKSKDWKVFVIDDHSVANAFVLPTGQIFVYTGIIRQCDNEDQLATILAHELSHTLLGHGNEVLSHEVLGDFIKTIIIFLLWLRLPGIPALFGTIVTVLAINLLVLPKRRFIETEADFIGLVLSAKTCYDVREGSAFWMKMASNEMPKWTHTWSTHPSHTSRYQTMDSYMEAMIKIMKVYKCNDLPENDPRNRLSNDDRTVFPKKH